MSGRERRRFISAVLTRLGAEFQVHSHTPGAQRYAAADIDASGRFVVIWSSQNQDGSSLGLFGRRFASSGAPQGAEFQVGTYTLGGQRFGAVALEADGDFVIAWVSYVSNPPSYGVLAQRYASTGAAQGSQLLVHSVVDVLGFGDTGVAVETDGDFVVTWSSQGDGSGTGIFARRFASDGSPLAGSLQVNTVTADNQSSPAISMDSDGDFVVVWTSSNQDGDGDGVFGRRWSSTGIPLGGEIQVNTYIAASQRRSEVSMDADGDFVVVWANDLGGPPTYGVRSVVGRRFAVSGEAQGREFQLSDSFLAPSEQAATIALGANGGFVVGWADHASSTGDVFARRFDADGSPRRAPLQVNTHTASGQINPVIALGGDGRALMAWESLGQDGDDYGIFAQRLAPLSDFDVDGNGATGALTDGILLLRFQFGLTGPTLITGAVGAGCTRCTAPEIEAYLRSRAETRRRYRLAGRRVGRRGRDRGPLRAPNRPPRCPRQERAQRAAPSAAPKNIRLIDAALHHAARGKSERSEQRRSPAPKNIRLIDAALHHAARGKSERSEQRRPRRQRTSVESRGIHHAIQSICFLSTVGMS